MQRDPAYIQDILESIKLAVSYLDGLTKEDFITKVQVQDAVIRRLSIIGEAARRISKDTKSNNPAVPWSKMVGMRNQVVHVYDGIDFNIVWQTIKNDLPPLADTLTAISINLQESL